MGEAPKFAELCIVKFLLFVLYWSRGLFSHGDGFMATHGIPVILPQPVLVDSSKHLWIWFISFSQGKSPKYPFLKIRSSCGVWVTYPVLKQVFLWCMGHLLCPWFGFPALCGTPTTCLSLTRFPVWQWMGTRVSITLSFIRSSGLVVGGLSVT